MHTILARISHGPHTDLGAQTRTLIQRTHFSCVTKTKLQKPRFCRKCAILDRAIFAISVYRFTKVKFVGWRCCPAPVGLHLNLGLCCAYSIICALLICTVKSIHIFAVQRIPQAIVGHAARPWRTAGAMGPGAAARRGPPRPGPRVAHALLCVISSKCDCFYVSFLASVTVFMRRFQQGLDRSRKAVKEDTFGPF